MWPRRHSEPDFWFQCFIRCCERAELFILVVRCNPVFLGNNGHSIVNVHLIHEHTERLSWHYFNYNWLLSGELWQSGLFTLISEVFVIAHWPLLLNVHPTCFPLCFSETTSMNKLYVCMNVLCLVLFTEPGKYLIVENDNGHVSVHSVPACYMTE